MSSSSASCSMLGPEEGQEGSDSMFGNHGGSLAWSVGAYAGICGQGEGAAATTTENWLYVSGIGHINILRTKGARFLLPDKRLNCGKKENQNEPCNIRLEL